jgi:hypothetical protein
MLQVRDPLSRLAAMATLGLLAWHPLQTPEYTPPGEFQNNAGSAMCGEVR